MPLSEIYWMNLNFLQILQTNIRKDLAGACYRFNLDVEHAKRIESLTQDELHALVANCGQESLFQMREDVSFRLLPLPPGLRPALAAVALPSHHEASYRQPVTGRARS
jgi:hypothetical protein